MARVSKTFLTKAKIDLGRLRGIMDKARVYGFIGGDSIDALAGIASSVQIEALRTAANTISNDDFQQQQAYEASFSVEVRDYIERTDKFLKDLAAFERSVPFERAPEADNESATRLFNNKRRKLMAPWVERRAKLILEVETLPAQERALLVPRKDQFNPERKVWLFDYPRVKFPGEATAYMLLPILEEIEREQVRKISDVEEILPKRR